MMRDPRGLFHTTRPGILLFRGGAGCLSIILSFYSYQKIPLAEANVLSFTRILWMVPLAIFVLHEKVGPRRIAATLIGFLGVLVIARPSGHSELGWATAAGLASALLFAFTVTGLKVVTRDHSAATVMAWSTGLGLIFAIPPALFTWQWPTSHDLLLLALMGAFGTLTQWCYIKGIAIGEAAAMVPFDYVRLPLAMLAGYTLFGDVPTLRTFIGAGIVIGSTLYITFRELRVGVATQQTEHDKTPAANVL
jgi:drug/metabolite transporter (DMT)-like permease